MIIVDVVEHLFVEDEKQFGSAAKYVLNVLKSEQ